MTDNSIDNTFEDYKPKIFFKCRFPDCPYDSSFGVDEIASKIKNIGESKDPQLILKEIITKLSNIEDKIIINFSSELLRTDITNVVLFILLTGHHLDENFRKKKASTQSDDISSGHPDYYLVIQSSKTHQPVIFEVNAHSYYVEIKKIDLTLGEIKDS